MGSTVTQEDLHEYKSRLLKPWELYNKPLQMYKIVDGYLMHCNAITRIGGMSIEGDRHNLFISTLLDNLRLWHDFAENNDILYTLIASNLISSYCSNSLLPWEDDIDISIRHKDWLKLRQLYNNLAPATNLIENYAELCNQYIPKKIPGYENLYICFHRRDLGKLKVVNHARFEFYDRYRSPGKMRGIDISCAIPYHQFGYIESFWAYRQFFPVCPGPGDHMTVDDCPEVLFSGTKTRAILPEYAFPYLINRYGTKWDAMIQPRLINKNNGPIPCKMQSKHENSKINTLIKEYCR